MSEVRKLGVQVEVTATGNGGEKAAKDIQAVSNAAERAAPAVRNNAQAAENLGDAVTKLGSRNNAAKDTLEGLASAAQGGEGAIFGMAKAVKGLSELLGSGLKLTALGLVIGAVTGGVKLLDLYNDRLRSQIDRLLNAKSAAERLKPEYEAMASAAKKSTDEQIASIKRLEDEFKNLDDRASEATDRISSINDAQKRLELAKLQQSTAAQLSTTQDPEKRGKIEQDAAIKRQAIEDKFAETKLANDRLAAQLDVRNSETRLAELRDKRRPASVDVAIAKQQENSALETSKAFVEGGGDISSPFGQQLQDAVRLAKKRVEETTKALGDIDKELGPQIDALEARIRKSKTSLEVNAISGKAQSTEESTRAAERQNERRFDRTKRIGELGKAAEEAAASGDFAAQDAAVSERRKLLREQVAEKATKPSSPAQSSPGNAKGTINGEPLQPVGKNNSIERAGAKADQAADKLAQAEPLQAEKLTDPLERLQQDFTSKLDDSQKSIDQAASTVESLKEQLPPPLDLSPFQSSFEQFAQANTQQHRESQAAIQQLSSRISQLASQLSSLRQ